MSRDASLPDLGILIPPPPIFEIPPPPAPPSGDGDIWCKLSCPPPPTEDPLSAMVDVHSPNHPQHVLSNELPHRTRFHEPGGNLFGSGSNNGAMTELGAGDRDPSVALLLHLSVYLMLGCLALLVSFSVVVCAVRIFVCRRSDSDHYPSGDLSEDHLLEEDEDEDFEAALQEEERRMAAEDANDEEQCCCCCEEEEDAERQQQRRRLAQQRPRQQRRCRGNERRQEDGQGKWEDYVQDESGIFLSLKRAFRSMLNRRRLFPEGDRCQQQDAEEHDRCTCQTQRVLGETIHM